MNRRCCGVSALLLLVGVLVGLVQPAAAAGGDVEVVTSIDGRTVDGAGANDPIVLGAKGQAKIRATITNGTASEIDMRNVKLDATALGITFVSYDTVLPATIAAGATKTVEFDLPIDDIKAQAVGLLPGTVAVYDSSGARIAAQAFTIDVKGDTWSLFGAFGILIALFTAVTLAVNLWLVARRRLPPRRFLRGVRFAVNGAGLGMTFCFSLAAFRIVPPYPGIWPVLVGVPTVGAFVLGIVSPGPLALDEDEIDVALRQYRESLAPA